MNQPTREEFEEFKQEVKEEIRQLREQITEPMKVTRIEVASEDVVKRLDDIVQKLSDQSELLKRIDTKQDDHAKALFSHSRSISTLQTNVTALPTKDDLKAMATKDDLKAMATKEDLKAMEEHMKDLLIKYLQPKPNGH